MKAFLISALTAFFILMVAVTPAHSSPAPLPSCKFCRVAYFLDCEAYCYLCGTRLQGGGGFSCDLSNPLPECPDCSQSCTVIGICF